MGLFIGLQELGQVRIRQHVNPLSASFSVCNSLGLCFSFHKYYSYSLLKWVFFFFFKENFN